MSEKKNVENPVQNENVASADKQGILNTHFFFFRDRMSYALGNAERSINLVGCMVYQGSLGKLEKPEHFPDQNFMGI